MRHVEPLAEAVRALRTGARTPTEYVERALDRAAEIEPTIESLVPEPDRRERVLETTTSLAETSPDPASRPPLFGVPVGVKDIVHVDGMETRAGSALPPEALSGPEGPAIERLRAAGAIVLAKTVTTEFAYFSPGPTRNPLDPERTPGGSSSGSAAAVAAGLCPVALGTQTVGSVIRPAAFCGVVGFKPTRDRIPTDGVIPLSRSVDHVGVFTQDTAGLPLVAAILCDGWRTLPAPSGKPTLGVPTGPYLEQASRVALDAFDRHLDTLAAAGYEVVRVDAFESIDGINARHNRLVAADAALAHDAWYREYGDRYAPETRELIETGHSVSAADIAAGRRGREDLRRRLTALMDDHGIDCWIAPAAPGPAPRGIDSTGDPVMNLPWTHAGLPTVTVPASRTDEGLPLGVQCAGRFGTDEDVIAWSHGIAAAFG
ncbi:amidase [Halorubrum vacuolatum]|uniref:Asp-tRNAAsn/Glu-tRNAGln amidotransferase A subunit n=1 Tax=Halorubrum vacuolatum TaxID=63740 RepID=A0A238UR63_HALVU|nr:amidase [Halorubrum vacuolatum]SNR24441.1 Asp-tRNAAsn/Glu-tRNAGln amidotransferase A subunit [Halorubrum vacuolatum]